MASQAPTSEGLTATMLGGLIAALTPPLQPSEIEKLIAHGEATTMPIRMMTDEVGLILADLQRPVFRSRLRDAEDPLAEVLELDLRHPSLAELQSLFRAMPARAAELGAATGVLLGLRLRLAEPELAALIQASAPK